VFEVSSAGKHHRETALVGGSNEFGVTERPAGLHHRSGPGIGNRIEPVTKREERIRCGNGPAETVRIA
jgi:hypothetical protein